jgi:small subunit ribosomal protein S15
MSITNERKQEVIGEYRNHDSDTGSAEVQVAILTARVRHLTEHLKTHRKDHASRRGLLKMVGRRARLLRFVQKCDYERYAALIQRLGIRR